MCALCLICYAYRTYDLVIFYVHNMQIKALSKGTIQLIDTDQSVAVVFDPGEARDYTEGNLVVGTGVEPKIGISRQGEYEFGGISVVAIESKEETTGEAEYFRVAMEGVSCLAITDKPNELEKHELDLLGSVDILIVYGGPKAPKLNKQIQRYVPGAVIAFGFDSEKDAEESTGLKVEKTGKTFKFSHNDFLSEDLGTTLYLLEK